MDKDQIFNKNDDVSFDKINREANYKSLLLVYGVFMIVSAIGSIFYGLDSGLALGILLLTNGTRDFILSRKLANKHRFAWSLLELALSLAIIIMYFLEISGKLI